MGEPILSASDLADLRQVNEESLPHLARILIPVLVRQPGGVTSKTYPSEGSVPAIACRVQQATADVIARLAAEQFAPHPLRVIAFSIGDVSEEQLAVDTRIVVTGETDNVVWKQRFDVIGVEPHRSYQTQRRALCVPSAAQ